MLSANISNVYNKNRIFLIVISVYLTISCNRNTNNEKTFTEEADIVHREFSSQTDSVKIITIGRQTFYNELLINGKIQAKRKANLTLKTEGILKDIMVREGDRVQRGQVIALLYSKAETLNIGSAELAYKQALLDYQDQLLRAGYLLSDTNNIDTKAKEIAKLRSGLSRSEIELQHAKHNFEQTRLSAPFAGKIANINAKPQNSSSSYEFICTLIDDSSFEVDFQVLEQELPFVKQASNIAVIPYSSDSATMSAKIISINPLIDEAGMVNINATVVEHTNLLLDGMSVQVKLQKRKDNQLVVPKNAVLDRQGRKVVFTLVDNVAKWNYVEIAGENSSSFAIRSGLNAGDKVIYEGNFNLAHDKPVKVGE